MIRLLQAHGFEVVAAVESGPELSAALTEHKPDVAVVDVRLPPTFTDEGVRAAIQARRDIPGLPVLVLSQYVEQLYAQLLSSRERDAPLATLTPREKEVLGLMAEGRSNAAIAARLFVTEKAVGKHTNNIFTKLNLHQHEDDNRRVLAVLTYLNG
jgi:DNA-binding NarL/FixJ family response regulator